ncbi:hypothetical protein SYNPS1DRAFT_29453 [Syncephalis pseudoplumigaleata]|uniref:C3H1-type domain-containing protein n=1 Tax=Syncephalis pseudoplumigaleata TaxID=1712513 RepID=A0A4P9YXI9_9FUNG|nr:hypothetical protein SYNPS1DRAFT_29453 [Syncephalis pseudoplumigaleata]|eukprot:RKP24796.1 hypothetical protein SYNPS1DRAFT_29453 [Syncephalis pseudoplumigaleata]
MVAAAAVAAVAVAMEDEACPSSPGANSRGCCVCSCDADPVVLADYVIALLKNDKPRDEMRELCAGQLEDFLGEYTASFVDNLLNMTASLDFLPPEARQQFMTGAPPPSSQQPAHANYGSTPDRERGRDRAHRDDYDRARGRNDPSDAMSGTDADRSYRRDRRHGSPARDRNWTRSPSRRRSASPSSRMARDSHRDSYDDRRSQKRRDRPAPRGNAVPANGGPIPVWNSDAGQMGGSAPGGAPMAAALSGAAGARGGGHRRRRCHQFDQKGFCSRGDTCPYEHIQPNAMFAVSEPIGYTPENAAGGFDAAGMPSSSSSSYGTRGRGGSGGGARMGRGRGRGGGAFDSGGASASSANARTILRVENISPEQCALDQINEYFRRFGTIVNIQVDAASRQALVQFSTNAEAYAAYSCQDAVFGNRFIKVFWHERLQNDYWQGGATAADGGSGSGGGGAMEMQPASSQSDADVKAQQRQAKLEQILDIQRKKEQLLQMQLEQQRLLQAQLNRTDLSANDRTELQQALEKVDAAVRESQAETEHLRMQQQEAANSANLAAEQLRRDQLDRELEDMQHQKAQTQENGAAAPGEEPQSEEAMLRAKLAQLQKEAEELGIEAAGGYYGRGRGRGRARGFGGWRGRGRGRGSMTWTPAMATGAQAPAAPTAFRLDNRTTKIQVRDLTDEIKGALQAHFSRFGVVSDISTLEAENRAIITYQSRHEAEKAAFSGAQMEGVGTLKMSWYNEPTPVQPVSEAAVASAASTAMDEDGDFDAMEDSERSWKR